MISHLISKKNEGGYLTIGVLILSPLYPLIGHDYESEILLMQKEIVLHKSLQLRFLLALSPKLLIHQLQIQIKSLFDVSRISNIFVPKCINHLGDNE
mgnify:CR=1 FL=1